MAGELSAVFRSLAEDAEQAAGKITKSIADVTERTADIEEGNLARTLDTEAGNARSFTSITEDGAAGADRPVSTGGSGPVDEPQFSGGKPPDLDGSKPAGEPTGDGGQPSEGNGGCDGKGGDPVDVVSGQVITEATDVDLPGLLPLILRRAYASGYEGGRLHGPRWSSTVDQRLEIDDDTVRFFGDDAQTLHYRRSGWAGGATMPASGARWPLTWDRESDTYQVTDPKTGWIRHFDANPADPSVRPISALTDRNGNRITFTRDTAGLPVTVSHSGGYRVDVGTMVTDAGPRITELRLSDGSTLAGYHYDPLGRLVGVVNGTGLPYRYEYDDADRLTTWIDRENYRYQYVYGEDGRVVRSEGRGAYLSADFAYDPAGRVTTVTNSLGAVTRYHYDEHNHLTQVVDPLGNVELTEYDRYHRLLSHTDPLGNVTRYVLGSDGDPVRIERPDGTTVTATYNEQRLPTEVVGPDGAPWRYTYDGRGNMLAEIDPAGAPTQYTYGQGGEPRTVTDALGNTSTIVTNAAGLPVSITDPAGATETYALDPRGRLTTVTDSLGAITTLEWSPADTLARRGYPDGSSQQWYWNGNGDLLATTDRGGFSTRFEVGPFHVVTARVDPDGTRHTFAYDTELRLSEVVNPQRLIWRYSYDPAGNLIQERDFNGRAVGYTHDAAGRLVGLTNGAGETVANTRDELGRITGQRTGDGRITTFGYDRAGRLVRASNPDSDLALTRDAVGRVVAETVNGRTITSQLDPLGRRTSRTTPTGHLSAWQYDGVGRPTVLTTGGQHISFGYDAAGQEVHRRLGTDTALVSSWDNLGQLTARQLVGDRGPRYGRSWTYRADGVPDSVTDAVDGQQRFDLDPLGRITAVRAANWTEQYAYDGAGNLTFSADSRAANSPVAGPRSATGTLLRQAGRARFDHDAQGRLVRTVRRTLSGAQQTWTYRYDAQDRLVEAVNPAGQRWHYQYDPLGRRIGKQWLDPNGTVLDEVRFTWDGEVLAEQEHRPGGTAPIAATTWDHEPGTWTPISQHHRQFTVDTPQQLIDQQFHAIVTDLVGTPTELVTADGRVDWRRRAGLWGNEYRAPDSPGCLLRFPGQYHDYETGLDYNYHRYYDPETGRYTAPDPLGLFPAPNHHAYADNPLAWLDPLGLAITKARYQHLDRPGWSNYTLSDTNGTTYYSGLFGPGSTAASTQNRHAGNGNRFDPANGDTMNVVPGSRTYGESRLMEQRLADQNGTLIGRDGNNYRGNRERPLAANKVAEYQDYETRKQSGAGCPP
ncbi:MAG TPA: DUF6531 domain-containing protein [Pseudonocardiaceae bacterium]